MTLPRVTQISATLNDQFADKQLQATSQKQILFYNFKGSSAVPTCGSHFVAPACCCSSCIEKQNIKTVASSLSML
jgi:hypothetical protein